MQTQAQSNLKQDNNLLIYQKYLELIYYTNDIVRKYPKSEKFALAEETKVTIYDGLKYIMYAQKEFNKANRLKFLNSLDVCLNILKVHIRIAYKYKYISNNNYATWSSKITDICNLLGGWISSCLKK